MLESFADLTAGRPRFAGPPLQAQAATGDAAAAWRAEFDAHGMRAPAQVHGAFAAGVRSADGRVWLAVDRFGIQSLCYRIEGAQIRVAMRADELLRPGEAPDIDPQAIFDYLFFHVIPSPRTIYRGVHRLPPGHCAVFEHGSLKVAPYWIPDFEEQPQPDFESRKTQFRQLLRGAVERELDGSKPACFLSGGTDSSTVAGMVAAAAGKVSTYSIGFDAQGYDEMAFARIAAKQFGADHHEYYVTPEDLVRSIPALASHCDQPFGNSSLLPAYYCAKMAREDGVSKLLAGDGGDELFGGNSRYAKQRVFGWYMHVPQALRHSVLEPLLGLRAAQALPLTRKAASYVEQARVPMPDRLEMYNLITRLGIPAVLTPQFLARVDTGLPLALQQQVWRSAGHCSPLNRELQFDWRFTLGESDLPKVRWATDFGQVRVGFPMLDDDLLDFSLKLPSDDKLRRLRLRWFFKEALRGFLPKEIIEKKKQGFGLPFGVWATQHAALLTLARSSLESLVQRGVVRADFVQALLATHLHAHPGYYGEMVWILMMLEQWLQQKAPAFKC